MASILPAENSTLAAAKAALIGSFATVALLAALHIASPEFDPSWRMVSEYALGRYSWLLSAMFLCWALSSWALVVALRPLTDSWLGKVGLALLTLSGLGEALAAYYDVTAETMHGVAGAFGIPTLPIAALLIGVAMDRWVGREPGRAAMRLTAHLTWISLLLLVASMVLLFSTWTAAGGDPTAGPPTSLPEGTVALNGWANRLLIICYCAWIAATSRRLMKLARE